MHKTQGRSGHSNSSKLSATEIDQATKKLLRLSQMESFPQDFKDLSSGKSLSEASTLLALQPLIIDGLICVGGRLQKSEVFQKHPIILHRSSPATLLLIQQLHLDHGHIGPSTLLSVLSEDFYIIGARRIARYVAKNCVACKRAYAHIAQQQMGQLPVDRVTPSPPFSVVGVDLAGPLLCKQFDGRKAPTIKTYACIFICLATKAVHLELLSDISTAAFLAALQRFSARRGAPLKMVSDNGKNFVGASREIQTATERLLGDRTRDELSKTHLHNLQWEFIPPGAPHFGGLWESGVRNMKAVLKRNLREHPLTFEELTTLLTVAEAALNS